MENEKYRNPYALFEKQTGKQISKNCPSIMAVKNLMSWYISKHKDVELVIKRSDR